MPSDQQTPAAAPTTGTPSLVNAPAAAPAAPAPAPAAGTPPVDPNAAKPAEAKPAEPDKNAVTAENPFKVDEIKFADPNLSVDPAIAAPFAEVVNKFGISREAVTALLDLQQKSMLANSEAGSRDWVKTQETWAAEVMADKDIGGQNWPKVQTQIGSIMDKFGSPELRQAFDLTGAGNHPAVVKFMSNIASVLTEGGFISSNQTAQGQRSAAEILYPNQGKS